MFVVSELIGLAWYCGPRSFNPRIFRWDASQIPICFRSEAHIWVEVHELINEMLAFGCASEDRQVADISEDDTRMIGGFFRLQIAAEV